MKYQRDLLKDVEGYVPGEQPAHTDTHVIKLNTNENPYPPSPEVIAVLRNFSEDTLRKYPDPLSTDLRAACAERFGYSGPEWVIAGNGSDELLSMIVRTFVDPGDRVVSVYPTYVLYETLCRLHGARYETVDLDAGFHPTEDLYAQAGRVCFFPRPNAPSGVSATLESVERLCGKFDGLVVIDEAYADFAEDDCMAFPNRFSNVIVTRSFSKSFGLAGVRAGVAVAHPELIRELMKSKDSYNLNALSQAAAAAAMRDHNHMVDTVERICVTRQRLTEVLRKLGFAVPDSQGNFVLARWDGAPTARDIFLRLREAGILVRYFEARGLDTSLRISVGTDDEVDALLEALHEILAV